MRILRPALAIVGSLLLLGGTTALAATEKNHVEENHRAKAHVSPYSEPAVRHGDRTIRGVVLDEKGQPVAGVRVRAVKCLHKKKHHHHAKTKGVVAHLGKPLHKHHKKHHKHHKGVVTDSLGRFTLPHVRADKHFVVAHEKGRGRGEARADTSLVRIELHHHKHHHKKA